MPLEAPAGWHELLAEDAAGGCVVLRVPPDLDGVEAIRQEADLAKRHTHEALLQSVGLVEHNGWPVQVVEHVEGMTLEQLTLIAGRLPAAALARIGRQMSLALVELHERAPVIHHGSLGADRIVIDEGGNARLADVGRARRSSSKRLMSPERRAVQGKPNAADDLWALGVIIADAALGGKADVVERGASIALGVVHDRIVDAMMVLVAPAERRIKNAGAAVRMFTEIEKQVGDGAASLRECLRAARHGAPAVADPEDERDITIPDANAKRVPFAGILKDAGAGDDELNPNTIELSQEPRTVEMGADGALNIAELRRIAAVAQEAARRSESGPQRAPAEPAEVEPAPVAERQRAATRDYPRIDDVVDVHDESTAKQGTRSGDSSQRALVEGTRAQSLSDDVDDLFSEELDAVGTGRLTRYIAAGAVVLALLTLAFVLGIYVG